MIRERTKPGEPFVRPIELRADDAYAFANSLATEIRVPAVSFDRGKARPHTLARIRPGDLLWCREPFVLRWNTRRPDDDCVLYGTIGKHTLPPKHAMQGSAHTQHTAPRQASAMDRYQSRLTLELISATRESLHCLTDRDARASGMVPMVKAGRAGFAASLDVACYGWAHTPREAYLAWWEAGFPQAVHGFNPPVIAITALVHLKNIDQLLRERAEA